MIREHPRFQRTGIIFVSAVMTANLDQLRGYELGAFDYVPVPVVLVCGMEDLLTRALGLSVVHGIAIQSGGMVRISSAPNTGTTVELWLPQSGTCPVSVGGVDYLRAGITFHHRAAPCRRFPEREAPTFLDALSTNAPSLPVPESPPPMHQCRRLEMQG